MDEPLKAHLNALDRAIVARGGQSIYVPKPVGDFERFNPFRAWEGEKLGPSHRKPDPADGFYRRYSKLGKLHLVRRS